MLAIKKVLHPTDFSHLSEQALHLAHSLARDYKARLVLLHVKMPQEVIEGEFGMPAPEPEASDEELLEKLGTLIPQGSTVELERLVVHGVAAEEIVRVAKELQCDLVVMGTHGRGGLARVLVGSIADDVARNAPCPVLTVRTQNTEIADNTAQ